MGKRESMIVVCGSCGSRKCDEHNKEQLKRMMLEDDEHEDPQTTIIDSLLPTLIPPYSLKVTVFTRKTIASR